MHRKSHTAVHVRELYTSHIFPTENKCSQVRVKVNTIELLEQNLTSAS